MQINDLKALLLLNRFAAAGRTRPFAERLLNLESPEELCRGWTENQQRIQPDFLNEITKAFEPEREIDGCLSRDVRLVALTDPAYPELLRQIPDPPLLLYVKGTLSSADDTALAIVGSREATLYGEEQAARFGQRLSEQGWTIVSGVARGIDRAAHEGALKTPAGRTIGVLGCGIDRVYPRENRRLYERIQESGALISEFCLGAPPLAHHFPRRNRIISGLAVGTLVVEAHLRSGSLITAREALEQGREVFALPGRVDQPQSWGTHQLIREGAVLTDSPEHLAGELVDCGHLVAARGRPDVLLPVLDPGSAGPKTPVPPAVSQEPAGRILDFLRKQPRSYDELLETGLFDRNQLGTLLLTLEIEGRIVKNTRGCFALKL